MPETVKNLGLHALVNAVGSRFRGRAARRPAARRWQPTLTALEDRLVLSGAVDLGAASQFGVLGLQGTKINNSNVTVTGNAGVSQGGTLTNMGPSTITGNVTESANNQYSGAGKVLGSVTVDPNGMAAIDSAALAASAQAAALTPTQTLGAVSSPTTITGNGGLNVINVNGNVTGSLTLSGTSSDVFIVNVSGNLTYTASSALGLAGGVSANHVLYNFTGASGNITSHVGNVFNGTLLAPNYSFNLDGTFNGEIIGGGSSIALLSGAKVNQISFAGDTGASLSGYVYADINQNGMKDSGETGLAGVTVTLNELDSNGNVILMLTATTDANGLFTFNGLTAGNYTLSQPSVGRMAPTGSAVGTDNGVTDGSVDVNGNIVCIAIGKNDQLVNYDFGAFPSS